MPKLGQDLRITEAAEYVGVAPNTLRNWDKSGKLAERRHPVNGYAVEGESLYEAPDDRFGALQLAVIGKSRAGDREGRTAVERVLKQHNVKLYRFDRVPQLVDEIRRTATESPNQLGENEQGGA